ncbi:hypothetical protein [Brevundimonas sp.]|uniref:hypothetical protein n=1 Tax=Brevundimonas sp. TaxID=1871086 RepID=UPI001DF46C25|nr:hypothetical protein [Brevundimonas sp.]MBA4000514.1 hypothetical protein [Brevundimonas sp.]
MSIHRRAMLGSTAAALAASSVRARTPAAQPALEDRLAEAARAARHRLDHDGVRFSGPAWDLLLDQGRQAQFFLLGEAHGIAENPKLAAALYAALAPTGYEKLAIEVSPPMAAELDAAAEGGVDGLRALFADPGAQVAFFGMAEEAALLADVRRVAPAGRPVLWGLDYEVGADRRLIARLEEAPKPPAAAAALATLAAASAGSWARYAETGSPQHIFSFGGDPALVRAVRDGWPGVDPHSGWILDTLEETLEINRLWVAQRGYESNARRARFNRANLIRYWQAERAEGRAPRVMFKFGAGHMVRGLSPTAVFDIGTLAPEIAATVGGESYHLLVLPGAGSQVANFDPTVWSYRPGPGGAYGEGLEPILDQALPDAWTLIDLRPLRPLIPGHRLTAAGTELSRLVHGFDAVLVMSGSTPSTNL